MHIQKLLKKVDDDEWVVIVQPTYYAKLNRTVDLEIYCGIVKNCKVNKKIKRITNEHNACVMTIYVKGKTIKW